MEKVIYLPQPVHELHTQSSLKSMQLLPTLILNPQLRISGW